MKLTYWYAKLNSDSDCYSAIGKTKKAVREQIAANPHNEYEPILKMQIDYTDAFDLFNWVTSEGGGRGCGDHYGTQATR